MPHQQAARRKARPTATENRISLAHGYPAWAQREEKRRNGGRGGERSGKEVVVTVVVDERARHTHNRPPLEVTRDLPRSHQAKLLDKYTHELRIRATKADRCLSFKQMLYPTHVR
ncbi:unnamed protein product [Pleuronectes platessa]|uniref:Uncharacterized protein n=1 Tax=Pleuronectes platessa TaxID=8262 RepID=A0A9N7YJG7_PLEPL|nr:unnamed protein product [Pleuronectes platessa]